MHSCPSIQKYIIEYIAPFQGIYSIGLGRWGSFYPVTIRQNWTQYNNFELWNILQSDKNTTKMSLWLLSARRRQYFVFLQLPKFHILYWQYFALRFFDIRKYWWIWETYWLNHLLILKNYLRIHPSHLHRNEK